jgi:hypothetical protein
MWMFILRAVIAGLVVASVVELAGRLPRAGALLLTLPLTSLLAFIFTWLVHRQMGTIVTLSRETLVLVPLGLPFFVPLALADRLGLGFWAAFAIGVALAASTIGLWFRFGPALG